MVGQHIVEKYAAESHKTVLGNRRRCRQENRHAEGQDAPDSIEIKVPATVYSTRPIPMKG